MIITRRRVVTVEDATGKLDALASCYGIATPRYEESEANSMSEFDALKWTSLCAQRIALQERENETASRDWPVVPSVFRGLYGTKHHYAPKPLENIEEGQLSLAA